MLNIENLTNTAMGSLGVEALTVIAAEFECDWAVSWCVEPSRRTLKARAIWTSGDTAITPLLEDTRRRQLTKSEGMPGHIWKRKAPFLSVDLIRDMSLPRSIAANAAGLRTGL